MPSCSGALSTLSVSFMLLMQILVIVILTAYQTPHLFAGLFSSRYSY